MPVCGPISNPLHLYPGGSVEIIGRDVVQDLLLQSYLGYDNIHFNTRDHVEFHRAGMSLVPGVVRTKIESNPEDFKFDSGFDQKV